MIEALYISVFGVSIVASLVGVVRLSEIQNEDTRHGLRALLLLSAGWGMTQITQVYFFGVRVTTAAHLGGLVLGLATVGAWLYFCSAYAGHEYHRNRRYRLSALFVFVAISLFKITNPWHGLYYDYTFTTEPFPHLVFQEKPIFWIIAGLMYTLSAIGFYLVYEVFATSDRDTVRPTLIVGLAFLPVVFDIAGYVTGPSILELNYESIGVALFALGILFVVKEPFFSLSQFGRFELFETFSEPVVFTDTDGTVQEYNEAAARAVPSIECGIDLAHLTERIGIDGFEDGTTVELEREGEPQYYAVTTTPIEVGSTVVGRSIVLKDVTKIERQRRRLEQKDDQLEGFATAITHELRNAVTVIGGRAEVLEDTALTDDPLVRDQLETMLAETEDVAEIVEDLETLARYSQTLSETDHVPLSDAVESARVDIDDVRIDVDGDTVIEADGVRLCELFADAFRFAEKNGASNVEVSVVDDGFDITDDGRPLHSFEESDLFAYGNAIPDAESGLCLPKIRMLAESHGWEVRIDDDYEDGMSLEIHGVESRAPRA